MKQLFCLFVLFIGTSFCAFSQQIAFSYKGEWSSWMPLYGDVRAYTDGSGLILKTSGGKDYLKFQINNFKRPSKSELKEHRKTGKPFVYYGTVDYYVTDNYPTAEDLAKSNILIKPNTRTDVTPSVLRHAVCEIRIMPYKNNPKTYNLFFDNIGLALSVKGLEFKGQNNPKNKGRVAANIVQSVLLFPLGLCSWLWNPVYDHKGE